MPDTSFPEFPADLPAATELLQVVLGTSQNGIMLLRPVYDAAGTTIVDLAWAYLNPAAQQMLQLPQCPPESFLTLFPTADAAGVFGFYRDAFLRGGPARRQNNYQHDGLDGYYLLVAQRQGDVLVVNFTDTNDQARTDIVQELRASQARELAARAETERQRRRLEQMLHDAPAMICVFEGPQHVFRFVNPTYQASIGPRSLLGRPLIEALPEVAGQPFIGLLDEVYRTGESFRATEMMVQYDYENAGSRTTEQRYYNFVYQARHDHLGSIDGIYVFAYDVTSQVLARREVQELNEELRASNDELMSTNAALARSEQALHSLNQELELRVAARTREAHNARAAAEHQRARLERLFMAAPAAICILAGPELVYELVNPAYQALFPNRLLQGLPIARALPEIAGHAVYHSFRRVFETGITHQEPGLLIPIARPDDGVLEDRYFNYIQQARFDEQGRVDGVLVFAFEVTAQVLASQEAEAAAQRLRLLTDALPVLISYLDRRERYQFVNQSYHRWFGLDPDEMLGQSVLAVIGPAAYTGVRGYIARALAGERLEFEARMPYRDDFVRYIHTDYIPDMQHGQVQGFYALVTDITEQVEAREQVQELNEELAAINEEMVVANEELRDTNDRLSHTNVDLDTFVYTASHDLKAPIANIEGLLLALGEQLPAAVRHDAEVTHLLDLMSDSVNRFQRTLGHLTDVSKLQQAHAEPPEAVDLTAMAEAVRLDLAPLLTAAGGRLVLDLAACSAVRFSPKNLRSILYNLLSNAIKYRAPNRAPLVVLRTSCADGFVQLEVHDNGLGLSQEQQSKLFVMFRRLHTHVEGTGVGLYMVRRIVENAGGSIQVQSQLGVGTTFTVRLPEHP